MNTNRGLSLSHDFNYNEAVNFCLPDWLPYDLDGVKKYKAINKPPVFSHDELLMTIYSYEKSPKSSLWLLPLFEEMVTRELEDRARAKRNIPDLEIVVEDEQQEDDQYQCILDKSFCYLSQITTSGHCEVACADHSSNLPEGKKVMKIRLTDDTLLAMLKRIRQRAAAANAPEDANATKVSSRCGYGTDGTRLNCTLCIAAQSTAGCCRVCNIC